MYAKIFKAVEKRTDTSPKEGTSQYGDVKFADATNKKYPIDTEEHIRAAWNYINKEKDAAKYNSGDLSTIKNNIIAAWKDTIDKAGPPSAAAKSATDPDNDGDDDMTAAGDTDHDYFDKNGKRIKPAPKVAKAATKDPEEEEEDTPMMGYGTKMTAGASAAMKGTMRPAPVLKHEKVRQLGSVARAMGICN